MLGIARDRDDVDRARLMGVHGNRESEVARQVATHLVPRVAGVVGAHHVPMLLHVEHPGTRGMHGDAVDAVPDLRFTCRASPSDRSPRLIGRQVPPTVVGAERPSSRDRHEHSILVERDRARSCVCTSLPSPPAATMAPSPCVRSPGQLGPAFPAVGRAEEGGVLDPGVDGVGVVERRLEVPHPGELPRMRRTVVPLVCAGPRRRR